MAQPFENRRTTYRYVPRAGQKGYSYPISHGGAPAAAPAAPAPAPAAQAVQAQGVPAYYSYPYSYYCGASSTYAPQYYYYPTTTAAPAATPVPTAAAPTTYTYTYAYPATSSTSHYAYAAPSARYVTYGHTCGHARHTCSLASHHTRDEVELNHRYLATTRGAYDAKKIKPVCEPGDLLWCREKDGTWNLRSFYNIENDCQPGRWTMDAEKGFCVFHRE